MNRYQLIFQLFFLYGVSMANNVPAVTAGTGQIEINGTGVNVHTNCIEGSGVVKTEKRELLSFTAIEVGGHFDVIVECQKKQCVEVSGDDNILPLITTSVHNGVLLIDIVPNMPICPKMQLLVKITAGNIENISAMGANGISISQLNNKRFTVQASGSGSILASGKTSEFVVNVRGSTNINAKGLRSEKVRISISGVAEAAVYASQALQAQISGVGNVSYYGNPVEISKTVTGAGRIEQKERE